jgi:hypothetical protein
MGFPTFAIRAPRDLTYWFAAQERQIPVQIMVNDESALLVEIGLLP